MSTLKDIYDIIKELRGLAKELQSAEISALVADIQDKYFVFKEEMDLLKQENKALLNEIEQLKSNKELEKDLELHPNGYLIRISEKNNGIFAKYCPVCWRSNQKSIPLTLSPMQGITTWCCSLCGCNVRE